MSQLEERLQDMESKIKELQQGSNRATLGPAIHDHQSFLPPPTGLIEEGGEISAEHPRYVYENTAEIGELDTAEDSIDGMGAMKFADEEDCGYFGTYLVVSGFFFLVFGGFFAAIFLPWAATWSRAHRVRRSLIKHRIFTTYILRDSARECAWAWRNVALLTTPNGHSEHLTPAPRPRKGQPHGIQRETPQSQYVRSSTRRSNVGFDSGVLPKDWTITAFYS